MSEKECLSAKIAEAQAEIYKSQQQPKTLRDEFAMSALTGLLAYQGAHARFRGDLKCAAIEAYDIADSMLAAREKKE